MATHTSSPAAERLAGKQSGFGRHTSLHALEGYTQLKSAYVNLVG